MSQQNQIPPASAEKLMEFINISSAAMQKAAAAEDAATKVAAAVDAEIPRVLDILEQFDRIAPHERAKTAEELRNPVEALKFMAKLAGHRNAEETARLGKSAGANGNGNGPATPPADQRGDGLRPSDRTWFERMGVALNR